MFHLVSNFTPSIHAFKFDNSHWPSVPDYIVHTPFGDIPLGNASNGLCGGMSFAVRDIFETHKQLPMPQTSPPGKGTPALQFFCDRLMDSLHIPAGVNKWWQWMTRSRHDLHPFPGVTLHGLSYWTIADEMKTVRATIDSGHLCPIGLLTPQGHSNNPVDMGNNHVVVAYGYQDAGTTTTLRIYDCNLPLRDDVTITFSTASPEHTTDFVHSGRSAALYGFFAMDWYAPKDATVVAVPLVGSISGRVTTNQGQPISGAALLARGGAPNSTLTDPSGRYAMDLAPGPHDLSASATNYQEQRKGITIVAQKTISVDFELATSAQGTISGVIQGLIHGVDHNGVTVVAGAIRTVASFDGTYALQNVAPGAQTVNAWANTTTPAGSYHGSGNVNVAAGQTAKLDIPMAYTAHKGPVTCTAPGTADVPTCHGFNPGQPR